MTMKLLGTLPTWRAAEREARKLHPELPARAFAIAARGSVPGIDRVDARFVASWTAVHVIVCAGFTDAERSIAEGVR